MAEIIPAILPQDFNELEEKISLVNGLVKTVQIDVCDGIFVTSKNWPHNGVDKVHFERLMKEDEGFPFWQDLDFEIDLMVHNPENEIENWIKCGAGRIVIHLESLKSMSDFVTLAKNKYGLGNEGFKLLEIGMAVGIDFPDEEIEKWAPSFDFVQFMGIKRVGYQDEPFDPAVLSKIKKLKDKMPAKIVSVDGGVHLNNAEEIVHAGADRLISGSAIYESSDFVNAIKSFENIK